MRDDLANPKFKKEYVARTNRYFNNPRSQFVKNLRNYVQHYQLPFISSVLSFKTINRETHEGDLKIGFCLDKAELLKWKRWGSSRKYIESNTYSAFPKDSISINENALDLVKALEEHQHLILIFYDWIDRRIRFLYRKELSELQRMQSEINSFIGSNK